MEEQSFIPKTKCTVEDIYVLKDLVWNEVSGKDYSLLFNNCKDFAREFYKKAKEDFSVEKQVVRKRDVKRELKA